VESVRQGVFVCIKTGVWKSKMFIRDIMNNSIAECTEDASLPEVYDLIQGCEHGYVVVLDSASHRVPIGIVTEHSICQHVIARGRNPKTLNAGNVMNSRIRRVTENTNIESCEGIVEDSDSEPILVTDDKRQFSGVVDKAKLANAVCSLKRRLADPNSQFGSLIQSKSPARVEIPAFGWVS